MSCGCRRTWEECALVASLLVLGLIHSDLQIGGLLDRLSKVHDKAVIDDIFVGGNTLLALHARLY